MAMCKLRECVGARRISSETCKQFQRRDLADWLQLERTEFMAPFRSFAPLGCRREAANQYEARIAAKPNCENLAQPRIEQAQDFVAINDD